MKENEQNVVQNITSQQNNQPVQNQNINMEATNLPNQVATAVKNEVVNDSPQKGSKLKTFGLISLFLLLFLLVMFLPQISSFFNSRNHQDQNLEPLPNKKEVYKTRICELNQTTAQMTNHIKLEFYYQNNALKKEQLTNTIRFQDANDEIEALRKMYLSCQSFQKQIEKNPGVKQSCSLKNNIYQIIQDIDYSKLTEFSTKENIGELEGFYPEFSLNQDRQIIEKELIEIGYVCKNKN